MRSTLDKLISWTGLLLAVILLVAGSLLMWGATFISGEVDKQLSDQKITMPSSEVIAEQVEAGELSKADADALEPYAGSQMNTGPEAKAYADHFILAHTNNATGGETYATLGEIQREVCPAYGSDEEPSEECNTVTSQRQTAQTGSTLRGLLLYGYAFATMGTIAFYASIAAFVSALLMLVLGLLGPRHAKKVNETTPTTA